MLTNKIKNVKTSQGLITALEKLLQRDAENISLLERLSELYRANGNITEVDNSILSISRLKGVESECNRGLSQGRNLLDIPVEQTVVAPFFIKHSFLKESDLKKILKYTIANKHSFEQAEVYTSDNQNNGGRIDKPFRNQRFYQPNEEFHDYYKALILSILNEVKELFGYGQHTIQSTKIQITATGNNQFGKAHQDTKITEDVTDQLKSLAFVFYYYIPPKQFTGGDLLVYDTNIEKSNHTAQFTRILNENNKLVVFPSAFFHEITPVESLSQNFEHHRFAISFWVRFS